MIKNVFLLYLNMGKKFKKKKREKKMKQKTKIIEENSREETTIKNPQKFNDSKLSLNDIISKKIAIPLKKLKLDIKEDKIKNLELPELKRLASKFDVNPLINFRLLFLLKNSNNKKDQQDYKKYINKYRFTLEYNDAKNLACFDPSEEKNIIDEFFNNLNIKQEKYQISSLSKLKLFNLLFYIIGIKQNIDIDDYINSLKIIIKKIESYSNDQNLIFKVPNNFGNIELIYYVYIDLFINYFLRDIKPLLTKFLSNNNEIREPDDDIYFDWEKEAEGKEEEIDMSSFEKRKQKLEEFINNEIKIQDKQKIIDANKDIKEPETIIKNDDLQKAYGYFIHYEVKKFKKYKKNIQDLATEKDNDVILKNIEFIFYSLFFTNSKYNTILDIYANCLYYNTKERNEDFKTSIKSFIPKEIRDDLEQNELVNINLDLEFKDKYNNIFSDNSKYYIFPILLQKNVIESNKNILESFKELLKYIYNSQLLKDIFYLTPEFNEFKYPLSDPEIFDEMIENIVYLPFKPEVLHGYTQKQLSKVFIAIGLSKGEFYQNDVSKIVNELSSILNTLIHQQLKHYLKGLIFYNSFRFKINKRIYSDLSSYEQDRNFMEKIRLIYLTKKPETYRYPIIDWGNRAEIFLYGQVLKKLYFSEAYDMFKPSTWNLTIVEHLKKFNENNIDKKETRLIKIDDLMKDTNIFDFLKKIFKEIDESLKCNNEINFDFSFHSDYRKSKSKKEGGQEPGSFLLDYSVFSEMFL